MLHKTCDGLYRRDFLRWGAFGTGLSLAQYLKIARAGEIAPKTRAKSAIFIHLTGGPSHLDTFDLKPNAPTEIRGEFKPILTNVPGITISEHLPRLAKCQDKFAIARGVSHSIAAHQLGVEYVNTGTRPLASLEYPGYGSVFTKEREATLPTDLPPFVAIPNSPQKPGFLGVKYSPLSTGTTPRPGQPYAVRGVSLAGGLTISQVVKRYSLLQSLDTTFANNDTNNQLIEGLDQFRQQAHAIITSKKARAAFDINQESPTFATPFGDQPFGMSCLLAIRLIEAGVGFVTLSIGGWDTHQDNFTRLRENLLPQFDIGLAALLNGLAERGLLDETAIFVTGEFGRTPKINSRSAEGGRDHYPRCMFMLMAGGGVSGGQVVGESDDTASEPANEGISPDDMAATFYMNLGIDPKKEYDTNTGRPITLVRDGTPVSALLA